MTTHNSRISKYLNQIDRVIKYLKDSKSPKIMTQIEQETTINRKTLNSILLWLISNNIVIKGHKDDHKTISTYKYNRRFNFL